MSLAMKMIELRKRVQALHKDTEGYGYNYVSGSQILSQLRPALDELNILIIPNTTVGEFQIHEYKTQQGVVKNDMIVFGEMSYLLVDGDNPDDKMVIPWAYFGQQDDISKAFGSALTYSERYLWLKILCLPTDEDDPDSKDTRGKTKAQPSSFDSAKKLFEPKSKPQSTGKGSKPITERQAGRLKALAGGDEDIVNAILAARGIKSPLELHMGEEYDKACQEAQAMLAAKSIKEDE